MHRRVACVPLVAVLLGVPSFAQTEGARGLALFSSSLSRIGGWRLVVEGRAFFYSQIRAPDL